MVLFIGSLERKSSFFSLRWF